MLNKKSELVEFKNMCMIQDGTKILVQNRIKSWYGIAFPGGYLEKHESIVDSVIRDSRRNRASN